MARPHNRPNPPPRCMSCSASVELERAGVRLRQPAIRRRRAAGRFLLVEGDLVREAAGRQ
eukprot:scaffold52417_cov61-Phaeocystis_antarctica.AAC.3